MPGTEGVSWPKVERFLDADEIAQVLFERLKDEKSSRDFVLGDLAEYHHGFGTGVRNEFHLWHPENPHTMKDYVPEIVDGSDHSPRHADNYCGTILEKLQAKLREHLGDVEACGQPCEVQVFDIRGPCRRAKGHDGCHFPGLR